MCLLLEAAQAWANLKNTSYSIIIGCKGYSNLINLTFRNIDFDHLSGMQYADDVDFKLPRNKYRGDKLIDALMSGKINYKAIEKSRNWNEHISLRLKGIVMLKDIIESDFAVYKFNPSKLKFYSVIKAEYIVYSEKTHSGFFLFLDKNDNTYYCKSIFYDNNNDYKYNQTKWTVLKKSKIENNLEFVLYRNNSYHE